MSFILQNLLMSSTKRICVIEWRDFVITEFFNLVANVSPDDGYTITVIGGVDGLRDGTMKTDLSGCFIREDEDMITWFRFNRNCPIRDDIDRLGVVFDLLDVTPFLMQSGEADMSRLGPEIKSRAPNALVMAYCWSSESELIDGLTRAGITPVLALQKDRMIITGGRCITVSPEQRDFIESVSRRQPRAVLIQGPSGSGKTILGAQTVKILVSHLVHEAGSGEDIELVVCQGYAGINGDFSDSQLMEDFTSKYGLEVVGRKLVSVKSQIMALPDLCWKIGLGELIDASPYQEKLSKIVSQLSIKKPGKKVVLFLDEIPPGDGNWTIVDELVMNNPHIYFIINLRPNEPYVEIQRPTNENTLFWELENPYRYSPNMSAFITRVCVERGGRPPVTPDPATLPVDGGTKPVWLNYSQTGANTIIRALERVSQIIQESHQTELSVTLMGIADTKVQDWCKENALNWNCHWTGDSMTGSEDQIVLVLRGRGTSIMDYREAWSRARNRLFILGSDGSYAARDILEKTVQGGLVEKIDI